VKLVITTNPGIEDLLEEELREVFGHDILSIDYAKAKGRLVVELKDEVEYLIEKIYSLTMAHRAGVFLAQSTIDKSVKGLDEVYNIIASTNIYEYITPSTSFAIRAERIGEGHEYTSLDVARRAGDAVINLVKEKYGSRPKVNLDYPEVIVHVDVVDNNLLVYLALTGDMSMHRRGYRVYDHPAALKPTLASAMIRLSKAREGEIIMDSMCGGGTIPIEAALMFETSFQICMDINPIHIRGAKMNAIAANVHTRIKFIVGDAAKVHEYVNIRVNRVISNPPYGIRISNPNAIRRLYKEFILNVPKILEDQATVTLITTEHKVIDKALNEEGLPFKKIHERIVSHGNLWPKIIVLELEKP